MIIKGVYDQTCDNNSGDPIFTEDFDPALNTAVQYMNLPLVAAVTINDNGVFLNSHYIKKLGFGRCFTFLDEI